MAGKSQQISEGILAKLVEARIARLATLDAQGRPHIVPVCFVYDGSVFYTAVDSKPKSVTPEKLARVRHITATPQVALLIDEYCEDWAQLWFIMVRGSANLIATSDHQERARAIRHLQDKYPQYAAGMLAHDAPIIRITPERITSWGKV
jgi:PPOX class probable F420-dependent enzyme